MTTVTGTPPANTQTAPLSEATTASTTSEDGSNGTLISSDFEMFLNLLTAQLKNQDPLNPLESTDFAVQLATFSNVEQQALTNENLSALSDQLALSSLSQVSGWLGNEVLAPVPVAFDGAPVALELAPDPEAARAELVVRDGDGTEIFTRNISTEAGPATWDGTRDDGQPAPLGTYSFAVINYNDVGRVTSESTPDAYVTVTEARFENGEARLLLEGGTSIPVSEITGLRPSRPNPV